MCRKKSLLLLAFFVIILGLSGNRILRSGYEDFTKAEATPVTTGPAMGQTPLPATPLPDITDNRQIVTPSAVTGYGTKNGIVLRWKKIKKASGYEIQYSQKKNFKEYSTKHIKKNTTTKKVIKELKKNTRYYVRIRAYKTVEKQKIYSDFSKVISVDTAGAVTYLYKDGFYAEKLSSQIKKRITGKSYKKNDVITYDDLRYVRVLYYNYNGKMKSGELIVNKDIAEKVVKIFYELYLEKYPIQRMQLIDDYDADDNVSMEHNNTSGFNFRKVEGSSNLSKHAYGLAIDINPRINPYIVGSKISPPNGKAYVQRDPSLCKGKYKYNMIRKGDVAYNIFKKYGFTWGGEWYSCKDYQHFQITP